MGFAWGAAVGAVAEAATARREEPGEALYAKLKPGPGRPAAAVAEHQRARIHSAMVEAVATRGYRSIAVREIARLAGVSTRAFYKHYSGKEDCFLRTHELVVRRVVRRVLAAQAGEHDWRNRLLSTVDAFMYEVAQDPRAAQLMLVDVYAAGPTAREQMQRAECTLEARFADCFARDPAGRPVPPLLLKGIVSGITSIARSRVLAGSEAELPALADGLTDWALSLHGAPPIEAADSTLALLGGATRSTSRPATSDRDLLLGATSKLVAGGYENLTKARICKAAGLSQSSFDSNFDSVEACAVAAFEQVSGQILAEAESIADQAPTRAESARAVVKFLVEQAATDSPFASLCLIEILVAGPNGLRAQERLLARLLERINGRPATPATTLSLSSEASMGGAYGLLRRSSASDSWSQLQVATALGYLLSHAAPDSGEIENDLPQRSPSEGSGVMLVDAQGNRPERSTNRNYK